MRTQGVDDANKNVDIVCGLQAYAPSSNLYPFLEGTRFLTPYKATYSAFDELMAVHIVPRVPSVARDECPYCLETLHLDPAIPEKRLIVLPCGHGMCIKCAREVLATSAKCVVCCYPAINDAEDVLGQNDLVRSPFYLPATAILNIAMSPEQLQRASVPLDQQPLTPTRLEQILSHRIAQDLRQEGFGSDSSNSPNLSDNGSRTPGDESAEDTAFSGFFVGMQGALSFFANEDNSSDSTEDEENASWQSNSDDDDQPRAPLRFFKSANAEDTTATHDSTLTEQHRKQLAVTSNLGEMLCPPPTNVTLEKIDFPPKEQYGNTLAESARTHSRSADCKKAGNFSKPLPDASTTIAESQRSSKCLTIYSPVAIRREGILPLQPKTQDAFTAAHNFQFSDGHAPHVPFSYPIQSVAMGQVDPCTGIEPYSPMSLVTLEPGFESWMQSAQGSVLRQPIRARERTRPTKPPRPRTNPSIKTSSDYIEPPSSNTPKSRSRIMSIFSAKNLRGPFKRLRSYAQFDPVGTGAAVDIGTEMSVIDPLDMHEWSPGAHSIQERAPLVPQPPRPKPREQQVAIERQQARQAEALRSHVTRYSIFEPERPDSQTETSGTRTQRNGSREHST